MALTDQLRDTQTHILGLGLAHSNIYPIYDLLECLKELVLWNHSCRISKDQRQQQDDREEFQ